VRRLVVVILMLLLPLQATWGMAASYCQHEREANVGHFGHHTHQHQGGADSAENATGNVANGVDVDCEVCHLGTVPMVIATTGASAIVTSAGPPTTRVPAYDSHVPDGLERPNRTRAV
jgi:hypothetical protein